NCPRLGADAAGRSAVATRSPVQAPEACDGAVGSAPAHPARASAATQANAAGMPMTPCAAPCARGKAFTFLVPIIVSVLPTTPADGLRNDTRRDRGPARRGTANTTAVGQRTRVLQARMRSRPGQNGAGGELHVRIVGTAAAFGNDPIDVLRRIL